MHMIKLRKTKKYKTQVIMTECNDDAIKGTLKMHFYVIFPYTRTINYPRYYPSFFFFADP